MPKKMYVTRKVLIEQYDINDSTISYRVKHKIYRTDSSGRKILLDDVMEMLANPPQVGRPPKIINEED